MEQKKFNLGDLVCLKIHPFIEDVTKIIISGEATMLSPIMVVSEVLKTKHIDKITNDETFPLKYKCIWFSSKSHHFIDAWIFESDLKMFQKNSEAIDTVTLKRGDKVTLKTIIPESIKKKSSLTYEDNSISKGNNNTIINSLLTFVPPIVQVVEVTKHQHKLPLTNKDQSTIRIVSQWDIKCLNFDPINNKMSELVLPSEVLNLIIDIDEKTLITINEAITSKQILNIVEDDSIKLVKPGHLAYRNGIYYLRAFNYISNRIEEIELKQSQIYTVNKTPFKVTLPSFDIARNPSSATSKFIQKEVSDAIVKASERNNYIRIKYKNRNDQLSHRSIRNYKIIKVKNFLSTELYLVGYCCRRESERTFRIDRIQNFQEIQFKFGVK